MLPHAHVHRRRGQDRLVGRHQHGARQITGQPGGHFCQDVCTRRGDQHNVGFAGQIDVSHLVLVSQREKIVIDFVFGKRAQAQRRDKLFAAFGQHATYRCAAFTQAPD